MTVQGPAPDPRIPDPRPTRQTCGRFVGRVGALAVALGIGTALAHSPGIALADDGQSSSSSAPSPDQGTDSSATSEADAKPTKKKSSSTDATKSPSDVPESPTRSRSAASTSDEDQKDVGSETAPGADSKRDDDEKSTSSSEAEEPDLEKTPGSSADDHGKSSSRRSKERPRAQFAGKPRVSFRTQTTATADEPESSPGQHTDANDADTSATLAAPSADPAPISLASAPAVSPTSTPVLAPSTPEVDDAQETTLVNRVLSTMGLGSQATGDPVAPAQSPALWAMLGWARREIGHTAVPVANTESTPTTTSQTQVSTATTVSPLGTPEQLTAEKIASRTVNTLPVKLMKLVLRQGFLDAANQQFPNGPDAENLAALDAAVDEFAMAAAFQQQLLNPMTPTVVTQVAPPHIWYGQDVGGSRILYDNPDTIYRFMSVSASSEYVITGRFHDLSEEGMPADTSFSVLEGLAGTTSSILTADDLEINEDGTFVITVSAEPADGRKNHLQLTSGSTIIAARNTLGDWNKETPMSLSIERVSGPPNSLFAQLGLFTFLGPVLNENPLLTTLVSLVPPLPYMPPVLRGTFTALILVVRGVNEQAKYMALATTDPETGQPRQANVLSQPSSNAEFLANQKQSSGYFELADNQALVLTIDPGDSGYFIVPVYNDWTITDNYWDQPTSLNNEQAKKDEGKQTYTVVISPTDPGAANWISTGGLNQGTISIRFQNIDPDAPNQPRIVSQRVVTHDELAMILPPEDFVTEEQRAQQLAARKAGYDRRWAPYPQP